MPPTDTCHHCGYAVPHEAPICPGCGRRHGRAAPRLEDGAHPTSALLRIAVWARRLLVVSGWLGLGLVLVAGARPLAAWDRLADDLADDTVTRLDHAGRLVALGALLCLGLAALATVAWTRRTQRHARAIGVRDDRASPWSLPGWLLPGQAARQAKASVDEVWRDNSPLVGALAHRGWSRRLVSRVVLHWWALWLWLPAAGALLAIVAHPDDGALAGQRAGVGVAAGALLVATARALYDVVGIITVAHGHREAANRAAAARYERLSDIVEPALAASPESSSSSTASAVSAPVATT
jgi:hypothetical protein